MVGKFFQEFFMFLINGERGCRLELFMRGCFERNGSAQNSSKRSFKREAYLYLRGTVPCSLCVERKNKISETLIDANQSVCVSGNMLNDF